MLGEILERLGELCTCLYGLGRLWVIGQNIFEVSFGDLGVLLVPIGGGKLVEVRLPSRKMTNGMFSLVGCIDWNSFNAFTASGYC